MKPLKNRRSDPSIQTSLIFDATKSTQLIFKPDNLKLFSPLLFKTTTGRREEREERSRGRWRKKKRGKKKEM